MAEGLVGSGLLGPYQQTVWVINILGASTWHFWALPLVLGFGTVDVRVNWVNSRLNGFTGQRQAAIAIQNRSPIQIGFQLRFAQLF